MYEKDRRVCVSQRGYMIRFSSHFEMLLPVSPEVKYEDEKNAHGKKIHSADFALEKMINICEEEGGRGGGVGLTLNFRLQ